MRPGPNPLLPLPHPHRRPVQIPLPDLGSTRKPATDPLATSSHNNPHISHLLRLPRSRANIMLPCRDNPKLHIPTAADITATTIPPNNTDHLVSIRIITHKEELMPSTTLNQHRQLSSRPPPQPHPRSTSPRRWEINTADLRRGLPLRIATLQLRRHTPRTATIRVPDNGRHLDPSAA